MTSECAVANADGQLVFVPNNAISKAGAKSKAKAKGKAKTRAKAKAKAKAKETASLVAASQNPLEAVEDAESVHCTEAAQKRIRLTSAPRTSKDGMPKASAQLEERILIDGPAAGWTVRVVIKASGKTNVMYRPPRVAVWCSRAQIDPGSVVVTALEGEASDIISDIHGSGQTDFQGKPVQADEDTATRRASELISDDLSEVREIIGGPAAGWIIRGRLNSQNAVNYSFRRPNGTKWESRGDIAGSIDKGVGDAMEPERVAIGLCLRGRFREVPGGPDRFAGKRVVAEQSQEEGYAAASSKGSAPLVEIMQVPSGAAIGWNIRCAITPSVRADWDVREPQGLVWRPACSLWESGSGVTAAVLDALREEIAGMAVHMGQGSGRRAPEKAAAKAAFNKKRRDMGSADCPGKNQQSSSMVESTSLRGRKRFLRGELARPGKSQLHGANSEEVSYDHAMSDGHLVSDGNEDPTSCYDVTAEPEVEPGSEVEMGQAASC